MDEPIRLRPRVVVCSRRYFGRDVHGRSGVQPLNRNAVAWESPRHGVFASQRVGNRRAP